MAETVTVGNVSISVIADVTPPPFEVSRFFPDVPPERFEPYKQEHLDKDGKFQTNFCTWVIRSGGQTVLVDTGLGPGPHQGMGGARGQLAMGLRRMGVRYDEVSAVVITHLHGDHMGWNVSQVGTEARATFSTAKYYLPKGDWDYFTQPEVLQNQAAVRSNAVPLEAMGVLELVSGEKSVTPEITTIATPGHTPGHMSVIVTSQGQKAMIVGDLFHSSVQVVEPEWNSGADMDKEVSRKTRQAMMDRLEREGFVVAAGHLPVGRSIGKVVRLQGRRYWQVL